VLALRRLNALVAQHFQRIGDCAARLSRLDDVVDVTACGGNVRVREAVVILRD